MQITDRAKDVIKSGGEWISSIEIENIAAGHPKAELAAVIGVAHPKWDERPLLLVKLNPGETSTPKEFIDFLEGKIAKWWTPDDVVFVDDIPLGATGKIDKKLIRERMKDYVLPTAVAAAAVPVALVATAEPKIYAPGPEQPNLEAASLDWTPNAAQRIEPKPEPVVAAFPATSETKAGEAPADADVPFPAEPAMSAGAAGALPPAEGVIAQPMFAPVAPPRRVSPGRARFADLYLKLATIVAITPAAMVGVAFLGVQLNMLDRPAFVRLALDLAPQVALISVATGIAGLAVALMAGFNRFWLRGLLVLAISAATLGAYAVARNAGAQAPPAVQSASR